MRPRLLVVDDEARQMEALCRTLTPEGYDVTGCLDPREALAALREQSFDVLLTDLMMPGMDGIELLAAALETRSRSRRRDDDRATARSARPWTR